MTSGIKKLGYYPGCTLKSKAGNLERAALASLEALGVEFVELTRWNCCGAVFNLADDDLIHHVGPVRNLIRAAEQGCDTVVTLCSQCYNTLARANLLVREDEEKRNTLNMFMDEEPDYNGEVETLHLLTFLRDHVGWDRLRDAVKIPLEGLKVAPFYGCTLVRPEEVSLDGATPELMQDFLGTLGAEPVDFSASTECCGSYQVLINPDGETVRAATVLTAAWKSGADALALSCPLCEYNLGTRQPVIQQHDDSIAPMPTFYFTQLLAVALGIDPEFCQFELNGEQTLALLRSRELIAAMPA